MRNKLQTIRESWTMNHKTLIVALALAVAHIAPLIPIPELHAEPITYTKTVTESYTLEQAAEKRAYELYKENEQYDLERYRHEALTELNAHLLDMIDDSPFIDYKDLENKYPQQ